MSWLAEHWLHVLQLSVEHLLLTATAVSIAVMIALPLGVWAHGHRGRITAITAVAGVAYTLPSLALFALLVPLVGLGRVPALIGLVMYSQLILVRTVVNGLDAVPEDARDAAVGMGIDRWRILRDVDAPLALPVWISGLRVASVTVIGIATIGAVIDAGGLGELILQGLQQDFATKVTVGALAVTILAVGTDALLACAERRSRSWCQA